MADVQPRRPGEPAQSGRDGDRPRDSARQIGVIHATPVVVNGCVYFGTATDATFYKLGPDGKLRWRYRNPDRGPAPAFPRQGNRPDVTQKFVDLASAAGILGSALVTGDTVFFADTGGWIYALDRASGAERWKVSTRAPTFPGAPPLNMLFASPILADGKVVFCGGALEQLVSGSESYRGSTGRGFVLALDPPITIEHSWGRHVIHFGPATSTIWSTPSFDAASRTIFFGKDVNTAPRRPTKEDTRLETRESCAVVALDAADGSEK